MQQNGSESIGGAGRRGAARTLVRRGWKAAAVLCAAATVVAGCSSSGSGDNAASSSVNTPPANQSQAPSQPAAGGASGAATTGGGASGGVDLVSYTGGTAGKADSSLSPVTIGYVNQQGGQIALPLSSYGADAAVKYINAELGGIGGHPLKLSSCYIVSEESEGQKCGQQFANDSKVKAIIMGGVLTGNASFYKTINGTKPIIGSISSSPADLSAKNTYFLDGATTVGYGALMSYAKSKGYKDIVVALDDGPGGQFASSIVKSAAKKAGLNVKIATYKLGATSIVGPLVAAGAKNADALAIFGSTPECILYGKSAKQLNLFDKPTMSTPTCIDPSVKKAFGDLPKWTFTISVNSNDTADPEVALFLKQFAKYEGSKGNGGFAGTTFEAIITAAKMINAAGGAKATPAQISQQLKSFKGPVYLGPKKIDCGADASAPASCTNTSKIQTYAGDGTWKTDGYFAAP